jgi:dTMP kinase
VRRYYLYLLVVIMTGFFISIEGIEGVGKTTAIQFLRDYFAETNKDVVFTREPGGTHNAESIRSVLLGDNLIEPMAETELMLMFASRLENTHKVILPAINAGKIVVADRYYDASYAYQGGGRGISYDKIDTIKTWVLGDFAPDLTILLDAPMDICLERLNSRAAKDRIEQEPSDFFKRVYDSYLELAQSNARFVIVDANKSKSEVKQHIIDVVSSKMSSHHHCGEKNKS